jgi:hypothetical protein
MTALTPPERSTNCSSEGRIDVDACPVQGEQPPAHLRVGEGNLQRQVDATGASGQRGLDQVGPVRVPGGPCNSTPRLRCRPAARDRLALFVIPIV